MKKLCLNVYRLCVKYYELKYMILKIVPSQSWHFCSYTASKFVLFSASTLKDEKLIKSKPT